MQIKDLKQDKRNYRKHNERNLNLIKKSVSEVGLGRSVVIDNENEIICGNGLVSTLDKNTKIKVIETDGSELVVVKRTDLQSDDEKRKQLAIMDNSTSDTSEFDIELLQEEFNIEQLQDFGIDIEFENFQENNNSNEKHNKLTEKFLIPPFSVFDTRQGYWQERKKYWNNLIGDNGESRETVLGMESLTNEMYGKTEIKNVSILDACLAEIINLWFTPFKGCNTFDCFAGDTVFGYVSAYLGNNFTGIELRQEQADLNNNNTKNLNANYICDDGQNVLNHIKENSQDLFFSCPPYFDLEVYSDLKNDASNQENYEDFIKIIQNAFNGACKCLKDNRFAVVVMSNVRDKYGFYQDICGDIINIFKNNGLYLYNEIILLNVAGTAQIRASNCMKNRKVCRVHQEVMVFYKGNPKEIKNIFKEIEVAEIESTNV